MGVVTLKQEPSTPAFPPSGFITLYFEGGVGKFVDENGNVFTLATGISPEEVQDIVVDLIDNTADINWVYDDPGNSLTAILTLTGVSPSVYGSASSIPILGIDSKGRVSSASNVSVSIASTQVTDFVEAAQDAIGSLVSNSASVQWSYNDAGNQLSAAVIPSGVDHNQLSNYVANRHIDHSAVSIIAGNGVSGGGDLTASRTLSVNPAQVDHNQLLNYVANRHIDHSAVSIVPGNGVSGGGDLTASRTVGLTATGVTAATYGNGAVPQFTVDAFGRITAASNGPALVLGDNFEDFLTTTPASNTGTTFSNIVTFNTSSKSIGRYRISIQALFSPSTNNNLMIFQAQIDGVDAGPEISVSYNQTTGNALINYFFYVSFVSVAAHTITLRHRKGGGGGTLTTNYVAVEMWRATP